jgi:hypothetical protein
MPSVKRAATMNTWSKLKCTFILLFTLGLSGCESISMSDMFTASGASIGAGVAAAVTGNPALIAGATGTGALVGASLIKEDKSLSSEQIAEVQNPWQAMLVALDQLLANAFELVIGISLAVFAIPMLFTYLLGRMKQRPEDAKAINNLVDKVAKMKDET